MKAIVNRRFVVIAGVAAMVFCLYQVVTGVYQNIRDSRVSDHPFLMTCQSGALMWGHGGGLNISKMQKLQEAAMPDHIGNVKLPEKSVGVTHARIGALPLSSNSFPVVYTETEEKMDDRGKYFQYGVEGSGVTDHYYMTRDGELHPVEFSIVQNYVISRGGPVRFREPAAVQIARIVGYMPPEATYAVYHRTVSLNNGATFDGWWAVPLSYEFRYEPTEGGYTKQDATPWDLKMGSEEQTKFPRLYQDPEKRMARCEALVHQTKSINDLFKIDKDAKDRFGGVSGDLLIEKEGDELRLVPEEITGVTGNPAKGLRTYEVYVGSSRQDLQTLPEDPQELYDDLY